ncbi:hypothetical protein DBV15_04786 [Temnothorax longispinosus]|uniref:Uncharacterized protein n=1 Tax=Temnothorax longispinosus TaxID=300112 RepID=A0A4S2JSQ7_9HYME|nr:hypothetical protein DBV15_04786 [Temnothorax longispinosus]
MNGHELDLEQQYRCINWLLHDRTINQPHPDAERVEWRLQITGWSRAVSRSHADIFFPAILRLKALSHSPRKHCRLRLPSHYLKAKLRPPSIRMLLSFNNAGGIVFPVRSDFKETTLGTPYVEWPTRYEIRIGSAREAWRQKVSRLKDSCLRKHSYFTPPLLFQRIVLRVSERKKWKIERKRKRRKQRKKRTKEEMEKAYRTITLADMTRPARFGSRMEAQYRRTLYVRGQAKSPRNKEAEEEEEDVREDNVRR